MINNGETLVSPRSQHTCIVGAEEFAIYGRNLLVCRRIIVIYGRYGFHLMEYVLGKSLKAAIVGIGFVALVPFLSPGDGLVSSASAQSSLPQAVIAVVNVDHILTVSEPSKVATEEINAKLKAVDDLLKNRGEELQKEKQELDKQRAIISPDAYRKKIEALNQEFQSLQRDSQIARAEFNKIIQDYRLRLRELITRQAAEVSAERGVNIGMDSARIVFFDNTMDITEEVLDRFNKSNPEPLKITVEQAPAAGEKKN